MITLTPAQAWREMAEGNDRFIAGQPRHPHQDADRRAELAHIQNPIATVFGCSDSRLAAEIIFDKGLGDLFVIRNIGQVTSDSVLGSLEFAVGILGVPLLVVLGHDECGAVAAAIASQEQTPNAIPPHIAKITDAIVPSVHRVAGHEGAIDPAVIDAAEVGRDHLHQTITDLLEASEIMSAAVAAGKLAIVGANYKLREGRVATHFVVGNIEEKVSAQ